jgi:hypothetical protein
MLADPPGKVHLKRYAKLACGRFIDEISKSEVTSAVARALDFLATEPAATAASAAKSAAGPAAVAGAVTLNPALLFVAITLFLGASWFQHRKNCHEEEERSRMAEQLRALRDKLEAIGRIQDESVRGRQIEEIIDAQNRPLAHLNTEDRCYTYIASNAMAASWDDFTPAEVLGGLGIVGSDSNDRIRQIEKLLDQGEVRRLQESWMFEQEYVELVQISLRKGKVHGYDSEVAGKRTDKTLTDELPLEDTFISLNLTEDAPNATSAPVPFEAVLDQLKPGPEGRLLVRGYAGMGKSTLINWAARTAAAGAIAPFEVERAMRDSDEEPHDETRKKRRRIWRRRIPFRIRMRDCENWTIPSDRSQFTALTGDGIPKAPEGWVENIFREGRAILFVDGLDEIPTAYRPTSFEAVGVIIESGGNVQKSSDESDPRGNLFVVTSRRLAEDPHWLQPLGFRQTLIAPLGRIDRDVLMGRWYDAAARAHPFRKILYESKKQIIREELEANPDVAQLTDSPLMCAVICNLCPTPDDRLPQQPQDVLELVCKLLASHRDIAYFETATKPAWSKEFESLQYKGRKQIAGSFAYEMIRANEPFLLEDKAIALLRDDFPRRGFDPDRAPKVLEEFALRVGLLRFLHPQKRRGVEFCHNVFKEFLAASHVVASKEEKRQWLLAHLEQDDCRNSLRHAIAAASEDVCDVLVEGLLDKTDQTTPLGLEMRLLAVRSVPRGVSVRADLRKRVADIIDSLVPPKSEEEADALGQVGHHLPDDSISRLEYDAQLRDGQQLLNIRVLRQIKLKTAKDALQRYAEQADSEALVLELALELPVLSVPWAWNLFQAGKLTYEKYHDMWSRIGDADMRRVSREYSGTTLHLALTRVSDTGLRELARPDTGLNSLTSLHLGGTAATDGGVTDLARSDTGLKALTTLYLRAVHLTDVGLAALARPDTGLSALTYLDLYGTAVTDSGLLQLARANTGLKSLMGLDLSNTNITDAGIKELARADSGMKALHRLDLSRTKVTDAGLNELVQPGAGLHALKVLMLSSTAITDAGIKELARKNGGLKALRELELSATGITDLGLQEIARGDSALVALTSLHLRETEVTDIGLKALATGLTGLVELDLRGTKITDAGLMELARPDAGLQALARLRLPGKGNVTKRAMEMLKSARPSLTFARKSVYD